MDGEGVPLDAAREVYHNINTVDARSLSHVPYRASLSGKETIEKKPDRMLSKEIVQPSSGFWSSSQVLVTKKDGSLRFCVAYRRLNMVRANDVHPISHNDEALNSLRGATYFSSFDLGPGIGRYPWLTKTTKNSFHNGGRSL